MKLKEIIPWIIVGTLGVVVGYQYIQTNRLHRSLKKSNELIVRELHSFDSRLGRAETVLDSNGAMLAQMSDNLSDELKAELKKYKIELVAISRAVLENRSTGGGRVVRRAPVRSSKPSNANTLGEGKGNGETSVREDSTASSEDDSWEYTDWRLHAILVDDIFDYALTQQFEVVLIEGKRGEATPSYVRAWELGPEGERLDQLTVNEFKVVRRTSEFNGLSWWNPRIDISLGGGYGFNGGEVRPIASVGVSSSSYGESRDNPSWRFPRVGVSSDGEDIGVNVIPVFYNVADKLPVFTNIWVGPEYDYMSGDHIVGIGVGGVL